MSRHFAEKTGAPLARDDGQHRRLYSKEYVTGSREAEIRGV